MIQQVKNLLIMKKDFQLKIMHFVLFEKHILWNTTKKNCSVLYLSSLNKLFPNIVKVLFWFEDQESRISTFMKFKIRKLRFFENC